MHQQRDIITTPSGRQIDITVELYEILSIGQWYHPNTTIGSGDAKMLHRLGWGLISIGGAEMAIGLVTSLREDRLINLHFASYLTEKWTAIAADFEGGDEEDEG